MRPRWLEPALVGLGLAGLSFLWIGLDRSVWPWDPAWYGEVSLDLYSALRRHTYWHATMVNAFGQKPPGIAWLGQFFVPLHRVVGSAQRALLVSIVLTQAATTAFVYAAARRVAPRTRVPAMASALLLAGAPLFVGLSHQYFAEPLQALSVAWVLYIMASATTWRPALTIAQLAGALGLGMLAKVSTPAYAGLAAVAALVLSFTAARKARQEPVPPHRDRAVVLSSVLAAIPVLGALDWYRLNGRTALHHAAFAASSELYGGGGSYSAKLWRWLQHLRDALFTGSAGLLAALAVVVAIAAVTARGRTWRTANGALVMQGTACVATLCMLLLLFAHASNEDVRFLLSTLPIAALLLALTLSAAGPRLTFAAAVLLAVQFAVVNVWALGVGEPSAYPYLEQPDRSGVLSKRLQALVLATCNDEANGKVNVVGGDYPWLNGNTMSLMADERNTVLGPECEYTPLGYAETDADAAWKRVLDLAAPYYVSIDYSGSDNPLPATLTVQLPSYEAFNRVNRAVFRRALDSGAYVPVPATRRGGFVVLQLAARRPAANYDSAS